MKANKITNKPLPDGMWLLIDLKKWPIRRPFSNEKKQEIADKLGIDVKLVSAAKNIIDPTSMREIDRLHNKVRRVLGQRATVKLGSVYYFSDQMKEHTDVFLEASLEEHNGLVEAFKAKYLQEMKKMPKVLKDCFNKDDYPEDPEEVVQRFVFRWRYFTLRQYAHSQLLKRFEEIADHIVDRLMGFTEEGNPNTFKDSLVKKTLEFCRDFKLMFPDGADNLGKLIARAEELLEQHKIEDLRYDEDVRTEVGEAFQAIQQTVTKLVESDPIRAIAFD